MAIRRDQSERNRPVHSLPQETARSLAWLQAPGQISRLVGSSPELGQALAAIARHAAVLGGADASGIYELDEAQQVFLVADSDHASAEFTQAVHAARVRVGQAAIGQAAADLQPVQIVNASTDPASELPPDMSAAGCQSVLAVPMISQGKPIGGLVLWSKRAAPLSADVIEALMTLADQAVIAIENARLYQAAMRRFEEVSIIQSVALAGAAGKPFDEIVADATERLHRLWDSHQLGFFFPDETLSLRAHESCIGVSPELTRNTRILPGTGITGWVFETGQPMLVADIRTEPRYIPINPETLSEMAAPLVARNRVIGVVNVESTHLAAFSAEDVDLLVALAGQLAIIFDDAQAHRDLAERARQLQEAYDELAEAERLKDQLVQNISHELRTPMTYIKGYTDLMLAETFGPLPVGLRQFIEIVSRKADNLTHLIERIVTMQAMDSSLHFEPIQLSDLAQNVIERWKSLAQQAGLEINMDLPEDLPAIAGDRGQLNEAFGNLLSNAIKFSRKGGLVKLAARCEAELVHIEVADTGIGIPPDKLARVFDRFYQIDGTTRRHFGGAGVGLALVRRIIEAHGGRIWAESAGPNQGSKFHLVLPVASSTSSLDACLQPA